MKHLNDQAGYVKYHVDHIFPVSTGWRHQPDNLQILTAKENQTQGAKLPEELAA